MYTHKNFRTKKALRDAVAAGEAVTVFQPNGDLYGKGGDYYDHFDGQVSVEGPHYPEPHRWYAVVDLVDGKVVKVK